MSAPSLKTLVRRRRVLAEVCLISILVSAVAWGCGGSAGGKKDAGSAGDTVYIEGTVSLRGSLPFALLLLEARDGKLYMIDVSPTADELKNLQEMPVGVTARILPDVKGEAPALSVVSYQLLALPSGEKPVVGVIVAASPENVSMKAEDDSIWVLEGQFKTVFLGLEGAKIWVIGQRNLSVNTNRGNLRSIDVTDYGIIKEPR